MLSEQSLEAAAVHSHSDEAPDSSPVSTSPAHEVSCKKGKIIKHKASMDAVAI